MTSEEGRVAEQMLHALEMVRDADEDCIKDNLPRLLPSAARATVDAAIAAAGRVGVRS